MPGKKFTEEKRTPKWNEREPKCPECGGDAMYWDVYAEDGALVYVLHCCECKANWERVYEYAYSRRIEN